MGGGTASSPCSWSIALAFRQLQSPTFRARLRLFFVVIVVVPMITIAVVLYQLIVASESSQTDARLAESQTVTQGIYGKEQQLAGSAADQIGKDQQLADALDSGDRRTVQARLDALRERLGAQYVAIQVDGKGRFESGSQPAVATATRRLLDNRQREIGKLTVGMRSPDAFAREIADLTGSAVVISQDGRRLATTQANVPAELPRRGAVDVSGTDYRVSEFAPAKGDPVQVNLLMPDRDTASPTSRASLVAAAAFIGFLALAFAFAVAVSRRLQSEIQRLLVAA